MKNFKHIRTLDEGKMKELHMLISQGKSAEQIAKIMKLDVKTIKALMKGHKESVELGEEIPANNAGSGSVAGLGSEPPVSKAAQKKKKKLSTIIRRDVDEAKVPAITFEFRNSMKAKQFAQDIENASIGLGDQVGNKVTITGVDGKWRRAVKQILQKNQGKLVQRKESVELGEALTLASDDVNAVKKTAQKLAKQSPDRTYYVIMNTESHIGGRQIKKYEVVDSVDMHSYRHDKKIVGYGAKVDMRESVELDEVLSDREVERFTKAHTALHTRYHKQALQIIKFIDSVAKHKDKWTDSFGDYVTAKLSKELKISNPNTVEYQQGRGRGDWSFLIGGGNGNVRYNNRNMPWKPKSGELPFDKFMKLLDTWKKETLRESVELDEADNTAAVAKQVKQAVKKYTTGKLVVRSKGGKSRFIMVRADKIDNELRKKVLNVVAPTANVRDKSNISYGNISDNIISASVEQWMKALGLKESAELEEKMTFEFGTSQQANTFMRRAIDDRLLSSAEVYKSNYGDYMVDAHGPHAAGAGSGTMAHKKLAKMLKKIGGKLHSTDEGPRIKRMFKEATDTFAGCHVFKVSSEEYGKCVHTPRKKNERWKNKLNMEMRGDIRQYAHRNPGKPVIVQDETSGAMSYLIIKSQGD